MRRARGRTTIVAAAGIAVLVVAATAPTIASAASATPAPVAATSGLAPATAATKAGAVYSETAWTAGAVIPLVTVESTATGPRIVSRPVASAAQARAVATEAARGNDLVLVQPDSVVRPTAAATNDTYSSSQWGIDTAKTTFANAWKTTTGKGITVAVIDTGVDASHPDLAGQVLAGKAFLTGTTAATVLNAKIDGCGHGTHVAGTIAALANNKVGVSGAAPGVKILPVKVLNCSGYSSDVANGIKWAADSGAKVINLSLGGTTRDKAQDLAIAYARAKGAVIVAAAGNNHGPASCGPGNNQASYPGASPGVVAVGAMDASFLRGCFSNTGSYVDVVGPGVSVLSTYPIALTDMKKYAPYMYMSGTSMATPHVAAAAALVLSRFPKCTPDGVEQRLKVTARHLGAAGRNNDFGYGLIDPARAITAC